MGTSYELPQELPMNFLMLVPHMRLGYIKRSTRLPCQANHSSSTIDGIKRCPSSSS